MSDSTFIDLHQELHNKGWATTWEFNQAIDLYKYNSCTTIDDCEAVDSDYVNDLDTNGAWLYHLGSLTDSSYMFYKSDIESFSGNLSSLKNSSWMFRETALQSFSGDLRSLTNGNNMFAYAPLQSFSGDLSSLTDGNSMFYSTALESFNGDLSSLKKGSWMFQNCKNFTSFSSDLSTLTNGLNMFYACTNLTSFSSDLSALTNGSGMFYRCKLDLASVQNIADTINTVSSGTINIGMSSTIKDTADLNAALEAIRAKGWTVEEGYLS